MAERRRVRLDEGVPERLRHALSGDVEIETVRYRGWAGLRNGDLLTAAEAVFDVLVTVDKQLRFQQRVAGRSISVVVLDASGTTLADLLPLVPDTLAALRSAAPETVHVVTGRRA